MTLSPSEGKPPSQGSLLSQYIKMFHSNRGMRFLKESYATYVPIEPNWPHF